MKLNNGCGAFIFYWNKTTMTKISEIIIERKHLTNLYKESLSRTVKNHYSVESLKSWKDYCYGLNDKFINNNKSNLYMITFNVISMLHIHRTHSQNIRKWYMIHKIFIVGFLGLVMLFSEMNVLLNVNMYKNMIFT